MGEWMKINSAPKDGTDILCYEDGVQFVCCWSDYEDEKD